MTEQVTPQSINANMARLAELTVAVDNAEPHELVAAANECETHRAITRCEAILYLKRIGFDVDALARIIR